MKRHLPNFITLLNLLCGCGAIIAIFFQMPPLVFGFLLLAGIADFADGLVARWLKVYSPMGKELDSLADMVSFGVVPGMLFFDMLGGFYMQDVFPYGAMSGFVVTLFACLRLAKFNIDTRQEDAFIGLATPSVTMFTLGLYLVVHRDTFGWGYWVQHPLFLGGCIVVLSYLLVSELRMFSFKFKHTAWRGNEMRYVLILATVIQLIFLREVAFSTIILTYILLALINRAKN